MPAPLIVFAYNRLEHLQRTLSSLESNALAPETELFIFSDGPKDDPVSREKVAAVRAYIRQFAKTAGFASVIVEEAETNRGLANSVIDGVSRVIAQFGRVVVVEDDLVCGPDFLTFINDGLEFYKDDPSIWSISGYTLPMEALEAYPHDVYMTYRGCSWGWGTWRDRWETVDWQVSDYANFAKDKKLRKRFARSGPDLPDMLDMQMAGKIDSWAVRWGYQQNKHDQMTVYPKVSRIQNIGLDGGGTHGVVSDQWGGKLQPPAPYRLERLPVDRRINRAFCLHFKLPFLLRAINKGFRILGIPYQIRAR